MEKFSTIKNFKATKHNIVLAHMLLIVYFFCLSNASAQCVSQGIVNYSFNTNTIIATSVTPGLTSALTSAPATTNGSGNGIAATAVAPPGSPYFTNASGDARVITGNAFLGGSVAATWTYTINGASIKNFKSFEVFFQTIRANGANFTMTVAYSKDGGTFQTLTTGTIGTTYTAFPIVLPAAADNPTTSLVIRMTGSIPAAGFLQSSCQWRMDNFQMRALPDPQSPSTTNTSICSGAAATITATPTGVPSINWYPLTSGGSLLSTGSSYSPANGAPTSPVAYNNTTSGVYTFYADATLLGCTSARTPATVTVGIPVTVAPTATPSSFCSGSNSNLNANIANGSAPYTISWTPATFLNSTTSETPTATNVTATTTYTVNVTDFCGNTTSGSVTLNVNPLPSITINSTPSPASICTSGSVSLTADNAVTYTWSPSTGLSATTGGTVTASPQVTTTYIVTGTSSFGCTSTQSVTVNVSPAVNILSTTATPGNPCFNASSQLNALAVNTNSYNITSIPFGFISSAGFTSVSLANNAMSGAVALPFNVSFYGRNFSQLFICSNGFVQFGSSSGSTGVFGQTLANAATPNNIIAGVWADLDPGAGGSISYGTTGVTPNRIFTIQFSGVPFKDQLFSSNGNATFQVQLKENGNIAEVHVQAVSTSVIPSSSVTTLALKNFDGSAFAAPAGRFNNGNWNVSTPEAWRFTPSAGPYNYLWSPATFLSATNISNPLVQNITSTTTYTVIASDVNGCSATNSVTVTISPIAVSCSSAPSGHACSGTTVNLQSSPSGGSTPYSYLWSTGTTTQNTTITASTPQTYTVTVTDACGNTQSCGVPLNVDALPPISINSIPSPAVICTSGSVLLNATGGITYSWAPSTALNSTTGSSVTASPVAITTYTVTGTGANGCTATQTQTVTYSTAISTTVIPNSAQVCNNGHVQLTANGINNYYVASIPFGFTSPVSPTTITLADDAISSAIALPFNFNFYGNAYSQIFVGSNGFIQFGSSSGTTATYGQTLPNTTNPNNIVAGVWGDLDPSAAGTVRQWVNGVSPNRTFTVEFSAVKILGIDLFGNPRTSFQIQLKENGIIEVHVQNVVQPNIIANAVNTTLAIKNSDGSLFVAPSGRFNSGNWNVSTPEAWRFYPPTPISYSWSPATFLTATNISNPLAQNVTSNTTYTVTVTDGNGCSSTQSVALSLYQPQLSVVTPSASSICQGTSLVINATDTSSSVFSNSSLISINDNTIATPYPSSINVSGIPATATVRSVNLNSITHTFSDDIDIVLVSPTGQVVTLMSDVGGSNGLVNVTYTFKDGSPAMSDAGANPSSTYAPTNDLTADNYPAPGPGSVSGSATLASFNANPNGSWKLYVVDDAGGDLGNISGGWSITFAYNAPFTYAWTPSVSLNTTTGKTVTASPVINTVYTVLVTDPNSSCNQTLSSSVSLLSSPKPFLSEGDTLLCSNNPGFYIHVKDSAAFSGGYPLGTTFEFVGLTAPTNTDDSVFVSSSVAATVIVTLPPFMGGCTATTGISDIDFGTIQAAQSVLSFDSVKCFGGSSGKVVANVTFGGTPNYRWQWYDSGFNNLLRDVTNSATSDSITGMPVGTYILVLTDHQGSPSVPYCQSLDSIFVGEPSAALSVVENTLNHIDVLCNGNSTGSIDISVNGGTPLYTYNWSNGSTNQDISGLVAGTYTCTITDSRGCTTATSIAITQPPAVIINPIVTDVLCNGGTGSIVINVSGGVELYSYNWSNGKSTNANTGISAGTYTVTVSDANGCSLSASYTVNQPAALVVNCSSTNNSCFNSNNGTVSVTASGGTAPYYYLWSNGANTASQSSRTKGIYTVTVTDTHGCTATCSSTVTEPLVLSLTSTQVNPTSALPNSGTINVNTTGGTVTYAYLWNDGSTSQNRSGLAVGTYTVTVTDTNGCSESLNITLTVNCTLSFTNQVIQQPSCSKNNGIATVIPSGGTSYSYAWQTTPVQTTSTGTGLSYYNASFVLITDVSGCTRMDTVVLPTSNGLILTLSSPIFAGGYNIRCHGGNIGSISLTVGGSTGPYTYLWNNGATTQNLSGLTAGTYIVTVSNGGCTNSNLITLTQPSAFIANVSGVNPGCFGGSNGTSTVAAGGGAAPYTYSWNTVPVKTLATASGLAAGVYTVTVSDANGCTKTAVVTLTQPTVILVTGVVTNVKCNGGTTGSINITPSGGTAPYTYLWTGGATTKDRINVLAAGTYTVTVTDTKGCTSQYSNTISQPTAITATATSTNVSCFGGTNGTANAVASGGTPPYTYSWNSVPVKTTPAVTGLKKGLYTVIITDSKGCLKAASVNITEPAAINVSITKTNVTTLGGNNGTATANVSGGVSPYTYSWNTVPVKTSQTVTGLITGTYTVTVSDANGCTKSASVVITQPSVRMADYSQPEVSSSVIFPNPSDGRFTVSFDETIRTNVNMQVYGMTGECVFKQEIKVSGNASSFDINLSRLPKGLYFIRYHTNDKNWIEKISIE
ncbi:MAG: T9SS type A sorting domain-containing protein [Bacteroidia bacterium]